MKTNRLRNIRNTFDGEEVNPMEGVANLADVMLVLAVGIMLALVVAWNVDIFNTTPLQKVTTQDAVELEQETESLNATEDEEKGDSVEEYGLTEAGTVYRDKDGKLYILEN